MPRGAESWLEALNPGYKLHHRAGGFETFDINGKIVSRTEPGGIETIYNRDGAGRLTAVTRLGRSLTLGYTGAATQPSTLSGPAGLIASYTYDGNGQLATVTYADGNADALPDGGYTYNYNSFRLTSVRDADGKTIETHEYWADGKAKTSEIAGGREKLTFAYSPGVTTVTDALTPASVTTYEWARVKGIDRVTKAIGPCSSCGGGGSQTQEWTYNTDGWISAYEDGEGNVTSYSYDPPTGDLLTETRIVDPEVPSSEITSTYTYYPDGRVHTRTDPNDSISTYTYVAAGPQTITQTINSSETRQFSFEYTALGQLWKITDPLTKVTELNYTSVGDLNWSKDPVAGHVTNFEYDAMGRLDQDAPARHDAAERLSDHVVRHARTGVARDEPEPVLLGVQIRRCRPQKSVRDPHNKLTSYHYDDWGRLWKIVDPMLGEDRVRVRPHVEPHRAHRRAGQDNVFDYDGHHRVRKVTYPARASPSLRGVHLRSGRPPEDAQAIEKA